MRHVLSVLFLFAFATASAAEPVISFGEGFARPFELNREQLSKLPGAAVSKAMKDHSSPQWQGVAVQELLRLAAVPMGKELHGKHLTKYLLVTAQDGYQVIFSLGELDHALGGSEIILAHSRDGQPLDANEGPYRIIVPGDENSGRWIRQVVKIELKDAVPAKP